MFTTFVGVSFFFFTFYLPGNFILVLYIHRTFYLSRLSQFPHSKEMDVRYTFILVVAASIQSCKAESTQVSK